MIVADSDVLIDFLAGRDPAAARVEIELVSSYRSSHQKSVCSIAIVR
jgi:hypothetical protein